MHIPRRTYSLIMLLLVACGACSSNAPSDAPADARAQQLRRVKTPKVEPQSIKIEAPNPDRLSPSAKPLIIEKDLFNVRIAAGLLSVNDTPVKSIAALEKLLASYDKPVVTLAAHTCMQGSEASHVLALIQRYTDSPIAFGSWGEYGDEHCDS